MLTTWVLILSLRTPGSFGAPVISIPGYNTYDACYTAAEAAQKQNDKLTAIGICIPGPAPTD